MDERDKSIGKNATIGAYSIFWGLFILSHMIPWAVIGPKGTIPTSVLPMMVGGGMVVVFTVRSLVIVILYRKGSHVEKE